MLSFFGLRLKFNKLNIFGLFATLVLDDSQTPFPIPDVKLLSDVFMGDVLLVCRTCVTQDAKSKSWKLSKNCNWLCRSPCLEFDRIISFNCINISFTMKSF